MSAVSCKAKPSRADGTGGLDADDAGRSRTGGGARGAGSAFDLSTAADGDPGVFLSWDAASRSKKNVPNASSEAVADTATIDAWRSMA
jgi:hypothetical protein